MCIKLKSQQQSPGDKRIVMYVAAAIFCLPPLLWSWDGDDSLVLKGCENDMMGLAMYDAWQVNNN